MPEIGFICVVNLYCLLIKAPQYNVRNVFEKKTARTDILVSLSNWNNQKDYECKCFISVTPKGSGWFRLEVAGCCHEKKTRTVLSASGIMFAYGKEVAFQNNVFLDHGIYMPGKYNDIHCGYMIYMISFLRTNLR